MRPGDRIPKSAPRISSSAPPVTGFRTTIDGRVNAVRFSIDVDVFDPQVPGAHEKAIAWTNGLLAGAIRRALDQAQSTCTAPLEIEVDSMEASAVVL